MKSQLISLLSFCLLMFLFCNTFAQSKKITKQIHVLLIAADDNTSIPEAVVYAEGNTFKALYRATSEQSGMAVLNVETGGNYTVSVSHPKFISAKQNIKVDLYGDKSIYVMEFSLKRKKAAEKLSNTLNVYVRDKTKKPIEGASVVVMPGESAVTNSSGYAKALHRQLPGEYIVVIASANGYKDQRKRVLVGVAQGNAITRPEDVVNFSLEKGDNNRSILHLIVEVLDDETNDPVKGANVKLQISDGTDVAGITNEKGEIKFTDMEYGYDGSGKVMVTHKDYKEKWSDVSQDLMTAKDMDERRFLVYIKKKETCTLAGKWVQSTEAIGTTTWTITSDGKATEEGIGYAKGIAKLNGNTLRIEWETKNGYSGTYEWKLNSKCSSDEGKLVFKTPITGTHKSTVKKN